ncbi:MAG: hypothetical protein ACJ8AD_05830 [Gemmatimonadaceae bacterium]
MYACRSITAATLVLATLFLGACGDRSKHAADGDTGAAAPATQRDMSATPAAPDPTTTSATMASQRTTTGDTATRTTKAGGNQSTPAARPKP